MTKDREIKPHKEKVPRLVVTQEVIANVKKLGALCLTRIQIAHYYGFSESAWDKKLKKYPELEQAMRQGKAEKISQASGKLWEACERNNVSALIFLLKTQGRWSEMNPSPDDEIGSKPAFPAVTLTINDPIEAANIYRQIMIGS